MRPANGRALCGAVCRPMSQRCDNRDGLLRLYVAASRVGAGPEHTDTRSSDV
jgi:hypothetical protein